MSAALRILVAIDESENSHRVVQYIGSLLRRTLMPSSPAFMCSNPYRRAAGA